jgi:hypothetical protein
MLRAKVSKEGYFYPVKGGVDALTGKEVVIGIIRSGSRCLRFVGKRQISYVRKSPYLYLYIEDKPNEAAVFSSHKQAEKFLKNCKDKRHLKTEILPLLDVFQIAYRYVVYDDHVELQKALFSRGPDLPDDKLYLSAGWFSSDLQARESAISKVKRDIRISEEGILKLNRNLEYLEPKSVAFIKGLG